MHFSKATILAAAAFLPLIEGHLYMKMSGRYETGDNMPPLKHDGSDYPCAVPDFSKVVGEPVKMAPGSDQQVELFGTAVHAGGSCQISITYDVPPNKNSKFTVLKSFEGGCPVKAAGNLPAAAGGPTSNALPPLKYKLPAGIKSGKAVIAWTWFNNMGIREMYMRCHQAVISGNNNGDDELKKRPEMFKANIGNGCEVPDGELIFPNPGPDKVGSGAVKPKGNCGPSNSGPSPPPKGNQNNQQQQQPVNPPAPPPQNGGGCSPGQKTCDGKTWAQCVNGKFVNMGPLAAGTTCTAVMGKRSIRFSEEHMAKAVL